MTQNAKPYRLINNSELRILQTVFEQRLVTWNEQYALFPLQCGLQRSDLSTNPTNFTWLTDQNGPVALCVDDDYVTLKHALFGDSSNCFNPVSKTLLMTLISQLLGNVTVEYAMLNPKMEDWFYQGSPALTLTLSHTSGNSMALYLHPQWVLNALPPGPISLKPIIGLNNALQSISINLHVQLCPIPLHLKDMLRLQVGDIIKTDHPIADPVVLKHHQQSVCHAHIGETSFYKSIQLTRT